VALFDVYASNGRFIGRSSGRIAGAFTKRLDCSAWSEGNYIVQFTLPDGRLLGSKKVLIQR